MSCTILVVLLSGHKVCVLSILTGKASVDLGGMGAVLQVGTYKSITTVLGLVVTCGVG